MLSTTQAALAHRERLQQRRISGASQSATTGWRATTLLLFAVSRPSSGGLYESSRGMPAPRLYWPFQKAWQNDLRCSIDCDKQIGLLPRFERRVRPIDSAKREER